MRRRNREIVAHCERIARYTPDRDLRAARIREYRESLVPAPLRDALAVEVDALRSRLGLAVAA